MPTSPLDRLHVVLVSPRNPLNIGAAARAMANFGFSRLRVVNPYEVAFREARSAVGAADILAEAQEYSSLSDAVSDCSLVVGTTGLRKRELLHEMHVLSSGAERIRSGMLSGPVALLFGTEKSGLSNEDLSHCHWLLNIPTREQRPSMNLGQAVALCLYEIASSRAAAAAGASVPRASAEELERISVLLLECLDASGYRKPRSGASFDEKIRRLVRRLDLGEEDALTITGMLRQIQWKIDSADK